jgi:hypothetical protein
MYVGNIIGASFELNIGNVVILLHLLLIFSVAASIHVSHAGEPRQTISP